MKRLQQMTVGELMERLADFPPDSPVQLDTEQNHVGAVKYRALGSVEECRVLSGGGREIGKYAILRFLERVPTPSPEPERKPLRLKYDIGATSVHASCGCPLVRTMLGKVEGVAHVPGCPEIRLPELKVGSRFFHRRADLFGTIEAWALDGAGTHVVVKYEYPHDGSPVRVPLSELEPA